MKWKWGWHRYRNDKWLQHMKLWTIAAIFWNFIYYIFFSVSNFKTVRFLYVRFVFKFTKMYLFNCITRVFHFVKSAHVKFSDSSIKCPHRDMSSSIIIYKTRQRWIYLYIHKMISHTLFSFLTHIFFNFSFFPKALHCISPQTSISTATLLL